MTDTYQAIYDGVRSRISNGDVGYAVSAAARDALGGFGDVRSLAMQEVAAVGFEWQRPSVVFRPTLSADGTMWCALLGENLHEGVVGFGETPAAAMAAFDQEFWKGKTPKAISLAKDEERHG